MSVTIGGASNSSDFTVPGLYPVTVKSVTDPTKFAVTNLAVQPTYNPPATTTIPVGSIAASAPSDVAINPATGIAVVANKGSNDISLINLTTTTPTFITNICTAAVGAVPPCPSSGPTGVTVDYVRNLALVVNSTAKSIAVVDLNAQAVTSVNPIPLGNSGVADTPAAIAVNPVTGRALVSMQQTNYGILVDEVNPPFYAGIVSISTGPNTRVAVEPRLNWALATPGQLGSLGIVDLNQQSSNAITAISRTNNGIGDNVVTVSVQTTASSPPLSVQVGDAVYIQNIQFPAGTDPTIAMLAPGFNGFYSVFRRAGPQPIQLNQTNAVLPNVATQSVPQAATGAVNYAQPVATVGLR